jgi:hypothetical protein
LDNQATCPSCQHKHHRRPEGTCPQCASPVDAAPVDVSSPVAAPTGAREGGLGLRLAGGVLLLNALLVIAERVMAPQLGGQLPGGVGSSVVSIVIDAVLGVSLLMGNERHRGLAILRAALGLLVFTGLRLYQRDMVSAVVHLLFSGALLMLLLGAPSLLRRGMALAGVGLFLLLQVMGLYAVRTGSDVLGGKLLARSDPQASGPARVVKGRKFPYQMSLPSGSSWLVRSEEATDKDNPLVDRWFIHSKSGIHLLVIGEEFPAGAELNLDAYGQNVINNLRNGVKVDEVQSPVCTNHNDMPTCLIRVSGSTGTKEMEYEVRLFSKPGMAYQLLAFGSANAFSEQREAVQSLALSFSTN